MSRKELDIIFKQEYFISESGLKNRYSALHKFYT